jgi:hypothetical protein
MDRGNSGYNVDWNAAIRPIDVGFVSLPGVHMTACVFLRTPVTYLGNLLQGNPRALQQLNVEAFIFFWRSYLAFLWSSTLLFGLRRLVVLLFFRSRPLAGNHLSGVPTVVHHYPITNMCCDKMLVNNIAQTCICELLEGAGERGGAKNLTNTFVATKATKGAMGP